MIRAPDTSVIVAAFASWHESHLAARAALDAGVTLIGHCAFETFSVLTRLPAPHRVAASVVAAFLRARFPKPPILLTPRAHLDLVDRFSAEGITGGAVYDGLVAATAAHHEATLLTLDVRAEITYARLGVTFRRLA